MEFTALLIFLVTYVLMISLPKRRWIIACASGAVFTALGIMPVGQIAAAINWNVLLMLAGTMGTVALFIRSKMPNRISELLLKLCPNVMWVAVVMSLFAGVVSAFVDNVATVLMVAPVALAICQDLGISPVPMLISISVSSNLQGAATLVGDTTSILLAGYADMNFLDFFFLDHRFSIFWAVELGALATVPVIVWLFRKDRSAISIQSHTEVADIFPTFLLLATVLTLIGASLLPRKPELTNGMICMGYFLLGLAYEVLIRKDRDALSFALGELDFQTLLLLAGLFMVIQSITNAGVIDMISSLFVRLGGDSPFLMYTLIVWGSVLFSAFVDNIPYVATMLPVVQGIAVTMGVSPMLFYFGLLTGATLGGNLTPIGASANIAAIGILTKNGCEVKTRDFTRIGIPFTLTAVMVSYLYCWLIWR